MARRSAWVGLARLGRAVALGCAVGAWAGGARAQDAAPPGASSCLGCHSRPGAAIPSLRGRDAAEVAAAMRAFREGTRPATLMNRLASGFSEQESQAIAAWVVR